MERLLFTLIASVLLLTGCSKPADSQENVSRWDPLNVYMVDHISRVHRIDFSRDIWSDVSVHYSNQTVTVKLSDEVVNSREGEILAILNFQTNPQEFSRDNYMTFLNKFHAYLTLHPVKKK
ncbi:MAG: hypothetical protein MUC65_10935 [Pontiellaceae bacterium]|jgi:PBP1b-binding outer membrane lipoprotein LpoB|nr:hypothetical protein [Pontiellaceae bacterium]